MAWLERSGITAPLWATETPNPTLEGAWVAVDPRGGPALPFPPQALAPNAPGLPHPEAGDSDRHRRGGGGHKWTAPYYKGCDYGWFLFHHSAHFFLYFPVQNAFIARKPLQSDFRMLSNFCT